jgi:hypothetical protein
MVHYNTHNLATMHIMDIPITGYSDIITTEVEICRLLRCSSCKCAAMHTQAFINFRAKLLNVDGNALSAAGNTVYMPEGLVLKMIVQQGHRYVELSWNYADTSSDAVAAWDATQGPI